MALLKIKRLSPDPILKKSPYAEGAPATIAHLNNIVDQINVPFAAISAIPALGTTTALTGTTVAPLRDEVEARLDAVETKVDAILAALKA